MKEKLQKLMNPKLLEAIQNPEAWQKRFTRREYVEAFRDYTEQYGSFYAEAVRKAEGEEGLSILVNGFLDALEAGWSRQWFWNRAAARINEKLMLVQYLSPMLLELEDPDCKRFAERLRDGWAARCPKEAYRIASFKKIDGGFRNIILGIEFPDKRREEEEDE